MISKPNEVSAIVTRLSKPECRVNQDSKPHLRHGDSSEKEKSAGMNDVQAEREKNPAASTA